MEVTEVNLWSLSVKHLNSLAWVRGFAMHCHALSCRSSQGRTHLYRVGFFIHVYHHSYFLQLIATCFKIGLALRFLQLNHYYSLRHCCCRSSLATITKFPSGWFRALDLLCFSSAINFLEQETHSLYFSFPVHFQLRKVIHCIFPNAFLFLRAVNLRRAAHR